MLIAKLGILFLLQLLLQGYLVYTNAAVSSTMIGLSALLVAAVHVAMALLCVIAVEVSPPYGGMPKSLLGAGAAMLLSTILFTALGTAAVLFVIGLIPGALVTASVWTIVWKASLFGGLLNAALARSLGRH